VELYYKDLISEGASLEQLVEDLMLVVQGADEFVQAAGANLPPETKEEITTRLQRLKESSSRIRQRLVTGAVAADRAIHEYPYSSIGFAFGAGLVAGALLTRNRGS
jgi:ElaB/YqjD/DUF883 family membrane-anchored ribosome-binding protein